MSCTFLSNKKSTAPIIYVSLKVALLAGFGILTKTILEFETNWIMILFWINVVLTVFFYFKTHLKDPGYVPHDAVFFTENDEGDRSEAKLSINIKKHESELRLKDESRIVEINNESILRPGRIQLKEKFEMETKLYLNKLKSQENSTHPPVSTCDRTPGVEKDDILRKFNMKSEYISSPDDRSPSKEDRDIEMLEKAKKFSFANPDENQRSFEKPTNHNSRQSPVHHSLQQVNDEEENEDDEYIVDCEASIEEEEDEDDVSPQYRDFQNQTKDMDQLEIMLSRESPVKSKNSTKKSKRTENQEQATTNFTEQRVSSKVEKRLPTRERENSPLGLNTSCNVRAQTGDEDQSKIVKMEDLIMQTGLYQPLNEEEGLTARNDGIIKISSERIAEMHNSYIARKNLETSCMEAPSERGGAFGKLASEIKKSTIHASNEHQLNQIELVIKGDSQIDINQAEPIKEDKDEDILYVERRYCTICNLEQPLRAKHCQECNKCVAQYDHHCPWLGTCIGEKNHRLFYFYVLFQGIELVWGECELVRDILKTFDDENLIENIIKIVMAIAILCFLLMVVSLVFFHTYLLLNNLTTWERLSWKRISYLKEWKEEWGSPFSKGIRKNLKIFCCIYQKEFHKWNMPRFKRTSPVSTK